LEGTKASNKIFTVSEVIRKQIQSVYKRDSIVTYEGVDLEFFKYRDDRDLRCRYKSKFIVLHATDFSPIKRTDLAFKIFSEIKKGIKNAKFLITNTIYKPKEMKRLKRLALSFGLLTTDFEFLGRIKYNLLPNYYSVADIYLHTGINQPQSMPVKEALACGTIVARSREFEVEFTEKEQFGVMINPQNIKESADKIINFVKNNRFDKQKVREYMEKKFSWDRISDNIYKEISI